MKLTVNGEERRVTATTLAALLDELDYAPDFLATARNGELVRAGERILCTLDEGDRIEILSPMQGG
ncbi:sulfur carrier protein ThiS [Nitratireductor aquimarinus]|uniref:sulfur carrier protein ThiS n=1 Tax=Alphaproteobacteria TaxID=28211 RepID=UPI000DDCE54C|nr:MULTISPECIES: sulfur carrier protein ThiS [Alphaproteobacteria]MBN7758875.1 sulfur carrier protein ThiS [Nitratireductor aquimarinus]MBY6001876.1 sulfur carrier protein ThiS [Tritonibacter mobilis]MBY6024161.1 sulfur carrier protein ThiS [Nitratireductor sp. DP7N14-4]